MIGPGSDKRKKVIFFILYNGSVSVAIVCCGQLNILLLRETAAMATSPIDIISYSSLTSTNFAKNSTSNQMDYDCRACILISILKKTDL